jgi:signal transduction histidine kinase
MPLHDRRSPSMRQASVLLAGFALALGGLVVAFVMSFNLADRQNRFATLSERQAGAVAQLAELEAAGVEQLVISKALRRYRTLIEEETALLPQTPTVAEHQAHEEAEATRLEFLAKGSTGGSQFRDLAMQIAQQEAGEVANARRELDRLHTRTVVLALALALAALLCVLSAAWLLVRRNRSLEAKVGARTEKLEEIDRSRRLFFAKASHELRTPVTAMRGEAEVALLGGEIPAEQLRRSLAHIHANATFLGHRIDELLGLASADDGKLSLSRHPLDLSEVINAAVLEAEPFARSVEVSVEPNMPSQSLPILGDARWLQQALLTVIDNGLKFSPMGGLLRISAEVDGAMARIMIADDGPGVMPDDLPRIFDAYYQSEPSRQRGGNGLGLALARWVTEQHGGTISATNRPKGGCGIVFSLPLERAP